MVLESEGDYPSQWQAIQSIAAKIGCSRDSLRAWLKRTQIDAGEAPGTTTEERERVKALEKEVKELRRANEILPITPSTYYDHKTKQRDPEKRSDRDRTVNETTGVAWRCSWSSYQNHLPG